jgi:hypothetical protein
MLVSGDNVLSWCDKRAELIARCVASVKCVGRRAVLRIEFEGEGGWVETTASHSFLTERGWARAADLRGTNALLQVGPDGSAHLAKVLRLVPTGRVEEVFSLITVGAHGFVAGGVVAHDFTYFRTFRVAFARISEMFNEGARQVSVASFPSR